MKLKSLLLSLVAGIILNCNTEKPIADTNLYGNLNSVEDTINIGGFQLINVYKKQLEVYENIALTEDSAAIRQLIIDELYEPYKPLSQTCFQFKKDYFVNKHLELHHKKRKDIMEALKFYDGINFSNLLKKYAEELPKFAKQELGGKFYFYFFFQSICDFCGCNRNSMQMDMLDSINLSEDHLKHLIPHEINHNIYELASKDDEHFETILYNCINEGFAVFFAQQYNNSKVHEAFGLTEEEYGWYVANEEKIKDKIEGILYSTDEEDWDPLSVNIKDSFIEGSPGSVGYYVGYRIIEEYLSVHKNKDWRIIYTTPVQEILKESKYLE